MSTQLAAIRSESILLDMEQQECPVTHSFGPGIYMREVFLKAGTRALGHHHKTSHLNIMLTGKLIMYNEDGSQTEMTAPYRYTAPPGRKFADIIEDTVWVNVHATDETDIDKLEEMFLEKSPEYLAYESRKMAQKIEKKQVDRDDYGCFLREFGMTESFARTASENESDQVDIPSLKSHRISDSPINGKGYFVTEPVEAMEIIAMARVNGKRTSAGRYVNHSKTPNAIMVKVGEDVALVSLRRIPGCIGGNAGDEVTICYRQALPLSGMLEV